MKSGFIVLVFLFHSCCNMKKQYIYDNVFIGMSKEELNIAVTNKNSSILIKGIDCDVKYMFCDRKLQAIIFKTERSEELLKTLKNKTVNYKDIYSEEVILRSSYDFLVSFDTLICIRSNKVKYIKNESALICN